MVDFVQAPSVTRPLISRPPRQHGLAGCLATLSLRHSTIPRHVAWRAMFDRSSADNTSLRARPGVLCAARAEGSKEIRGSSLGCDLRGRAAWRAMLEDAEPRRFTVLLVWKLDRAFRSTLHAADSLNRLQGHGVALKSLTEEWADGTTPAGALMRTILVAFAVRA